MKPNVLASALLVCLAEALLCVVVVALLQWFL